MKHMFLTFAFALVSASAFAQPQIHVGTEVEMTRITNSYDGHDGIGREDEHYHGATQMIVAAISPVHKVGGTIRIGAISDVSIHTNDTGRGWDQKDPYFTGGDITKVEMLANYQINRFVDVFGGYNHFGYETNSHQALYQYPTYALVTSDVSLYERYSGWPLGVTGHMTRSRYEITGTLSKLLFLTRTDSYQQNYNQQYMGIQVFGGQSSTDASAYQLAARGNIRLSHNLTVNAAVSQQMVTTPYGNHLFGVVDFKIAEHSRWRTASVGINYGF